MGAQASRLPCWIQGRRLAWRRCPRRWDVACLAAGRGERTDRRSSRMAPRPSGVAAFPRGNARPRHRPTGV